MPHAVSYTLEALVRFYSLMCRLCRAFCSSRASSFKACKVSVPSCSMSNVQQSSSPDISLLSPLLQCQWHHAKNAHLGDTVVKPHTHRKMWWTCDHALMANPMNGRQQSTTGQAAQAVPSVTTKLSVCTTPLPPMPLPLPPSSVTVMRAHHISTQSAARRVSHGSVSMDTSGMHESAVAQNTELVALFATTPAEKCRPGSSILHCRTASIQ